MTDSYLATSVIEARARKYALTLFNALCDLLDDTQHAEHRCGEVECPVAQAQAAVRLVDPKAFPEPAAQTDAPQ